MFNIASAVAAVFVPILDNGAPLPTTCEASPDIILSMAWLANVLDPALVCTMPTACNISVKSTKASNSSGSKIVSYNWALLLCCLNAALSFNHAASWAASSKISRWLLPAEPGGLTLVMPVFIPILLKNLFGTPKTFVVCCTASSH